MTTEYDTEYTPETTVKPVPVYIVDEGKEELFGKILNHDDYPSPSVVTNGGQTVYNMNREGWFYDIRIFSCQTFTGGTVTVYKNAIADANIVFTFTSAGIVTWSKGERLLRQGDSLIFVGSGVVGNYTPSLSGYLVRREIFADYMM